MCQTVRRFRRSLWLRRHLTIMFVSVHLYSFGAVTFSNPIWVCLSQCACVSFSLPDLLALQVLAISRICPNAEGRLYTVGAVALAAFFSRLDYRNGKEYDCFFLFMATMDDLWNLDVLCLQVASQLGLIRTWFIWKIHERTWDTSSFQFWFLEVSQILAHMRPIIGRKRSSHHALANLHCPVSTQVGFNV